MDSKKFPKLNNLYLACRIDKFEMTMLIQRDNYDRYSADVFCHSTVFIAVLLFVALSFSGAKAQKANNLDEILKPAQSRLYATVDMQVLCSHIDTPGNITGLKAAALCKRSLDLALENGWSDGFMESTSKLIANAKNPAELNESIVTLVLKSPKSTPGIGYCAVEISQCFSKPFTRRELGTVNGAPGFNDNADFKPGRVIPVDRGFAFTAGATLAAANPALAKKLVQELSVETDPKTKKVTRKNPPITDIKNAELLLEICISNGVTGDGARVIDASLCGLGGIAYGLLKTKGTTR